MLLIYQRFFKKTIKHIVVFVFFIALGLPASSTHADSETIAIVNDIPITRKDLKWVARPFKTDDQYSDNRNLKNLQDRLINRELLYQESIAQGIVVSDKEIKNKLTKLLKSLKTTQSRLCRETGLSADDMAFELKKDIGIQKLRQQALPRIKAVDTQEARNYYLANPDQFIVKGPVRVRHILIKVDPEADTEAKDQARKKLYGVLERLRKGEDFSELAKTYSDCPSRIKGGDIGFVHHGQKYKNFENTAFSLKSGEISEIVETPLGYHLLTITEKKPPSVIPFEKVAKKLKSFLFKEKQQRQLKNLVQKIKSKSDVRVYQ